MSQVGFAIIGCGAIAAVHARAIAATPAARLVAVADRRRDRAEAAAALGAGIAVYEDYEAMLDRDDVQVACVTTPSGAHLEPVLAAAARSASVLVEKPLEVTLERVDRMIEACRTAGVRLGAVFQSRFGRGAGAVKAAIDRGRLGRIVLADAYVKWHRPQSYYDSGDWRGTRKFDGGGALMNQSIHAIDLLQWLAGMPDRVCAMTALLGHQGLEVEDTAVSAVRYPGGALGVIEGSTAAYPGWAKRIEICGTDGSVVLEDDRIATWDVRDPTPEDERIRRDFASADIGGGASDPKAIDLEGHRRQIEDMARAVIENRPPRIPGEEGRNAVALILAIYESARSEGPVAPARCGDAR